MSESWPTTERDELTRLMVMAGASSDMMNAATCALTEVRFDERAQWAAFLRSLPGSEDWTVNGQAVADMIDPHKSPPLTIIKEQFGYGEA